MYQRRTGYYNEHEDLINKMFEGEDWKHLAGQQTKKQWVHTCRTKCQILLREYELPTDPRVIENDNKATYKHKHNNDIDTNDKYNSDTASIEKEGLNEQWQSTKGCFRIVVDNQTM